ncbi:MAG TPA: dephospho-CoA kinase [Chloroflexota bacterium]|nr:dephospho-CoA kinase [Chloroflexota bacterium]
MTPEDWPRRPDIYLIGITGNIATGKSTIDAMLAAKGAEVLDADRVVHELERKGQPAWQRIVERFGEGILTAQGELDRAKLGQVVFSDPVALQDLELIVHPAVRDEERRRILEAAPGTVMVVDAIKLFESGMADACNSVWAVTAPADQQFARLQRQRGMATEVAWQRIRAQPPQSEKAALASVVIDNGGSLEDTEQQVDAAWARTAGAWQAGRSG